MANPLHLGQGLAIDAGKCRVGTPLHMGHSRNRQVRWVSTDKGWLLAGLPDPENVAAS